MDLLLRIHVHIWMGFHDFLHSRSPGLRPAEMCALHSMAVVIALVGTPDMQHSLITQPQPHTGLPRAVSQTLCLHVPCGTMSTAETGRHLGNIALGVAFELQDGCYICRHGTGGP